VTAATSKVPRSKTQVNSAPFENPLIPNKRLCAVYTAMAELRLLDAFVASRANAKKPKVQLQASLGLEACRVSTALNLEPGDLTSESAPSIATRFLRGAKLAELIAQVEAFHTGPRKAAAAFSSASELPLLAPGKERIYLALGAAQTLKAAPSGKTAKLSRILVAYVNPTELNTSASMRCRSSSSPFRTHRSPPQRSVALAATQLRPGSPASWSTPPIRSRSIASCRSRSSACATTAAPC